MVKIKTPQEILKIIKDTDLLGTKTEKRNCLPDLIKFLKANIQGSYYYSNVGGSYQEIWQNIAKIFENLSRFIEAKIIYETLYEELTIAQIKENKHVHKGMPLVWLRDIYVKRKNPWSAQRYILLTIIEDSISFNGEILPNKSGAYHRSVWYHGIPDDIFWKFSKKAYKLYLSDNVKYMFPERILLELKEFFSIAYPSVDEIDSFLVNRFFLKYWYEVLQLKENCSKEFEDFCAYLLSCLPGFEVVERYQTGDYHFDLLVRNKSNPLDFRADFGNYIITESKFWSEPITPEVISYFATKMVFHDIKAGIIFSKNDITGGKRNKFATLTLIKSYYKNSRIIMIINEKDLKKIFSGINIIKILQEKYEITRFT